MTDNAAGKWKLVETTNFDEYMKAVGVGMVMRKLGATAKPVQEITIDGDKWHIKTSTTFKTTELDFSVGQEFDEVTADGRNVKTVCTIDENKLVQTQKGDPDSTIIREFKGDDMIMTLEAKGVTCTRRYQKEA